LKKGKFRYFRAHPKTPNKSKPYEKINKNNQNQIFGLNYSPALPKTAKNMAKADAI
jgi:hypothetical protein